jgi:SnoaL-like domain
VSIADHQAVTETIYKYAYGIDTKDFALYRSIFADDVAIDFTSYRPGRPAATVPADEWVSSVIPLFTGLAASQHSMSNPLVEVTGDRAVCRMYVRAAHALEHGNDDAWFTLGGYYRDTLVRTLDGWRIDGVTLTVLWRRGDASIMAEAARRGLAKLK